jgi:hypothetical protein
MDKINVLTNIIGGGIFVNSMNNLTLWGLCCTIIFFVCICGVVWFWNNRTETKIIRYESKKPVVRLKKSEKEKAKSKKSTSTKKTKRKPSSQKK